MTLMFIFGLVVLPLAVLVIVFAFGAGGGIRLGSSAGTELSDRFRGLCVSLAILTVLVLVAASFMAGFVAGRMS